MDSKHTNRQESINFHDGQSPALAANGAQPPPLRRTEAFIRRQTYLEVAMPSELSAPSFIGLQRSCRVGFGCIGTVRRQRRLRDVGR